MPHHVSTRLFHSHADGNEDTASTTIGVQVSLLAIIAEASESISTDFLCLQSYASGLGGTIPLLLSSNVSSVKLYMLESDPTKALPKDSSLSSYSLHKLHLSPP